MKLFFSVDKIKRKRGRHKNRRRDSLHHVQEWVWPSIGGKAYLRFMEIKIKRARGSSHAIALGFAGGVFASFTPFVGLHTPIALLVSWPFGGSMIMAWIGTLVGNPWTFPLIWLWTYELGNFILGRDKPVALPQEFNLSHFINNFNHYFDAYLLPMTVGGVPTGMLVATICYVLIYNNLKTYRRARAKFLKERRKKRLTAVATKTKELTGSIIKGAANLTQKTLKDSTDKDEKTKQKNEE